MLSKLSLFHTTEASIETLKSAISNLEWMLTNDFNQKDLLLLSDFIHGQLESSKGLRDPTVLSKIIKICQGWACSLESEANLAKSLCRLLLTFPLDLNAAALETIAQDSIAIIGSVDVDDDQMNRQLDSIKFKFVTAKSIYPLLGCILPYLKAQLDKYEQVLELACLTCATSSSNGSKTFGYLCQEAALVALICTQFCRAGIIGANFSRLIESLQVLFKFAWNICKYVPPFLSWFT